jgi:ubiquitin carboxyl-terminal hydrolase 25/28
MEKNKYILHAICVHDGSAESGHYYTFIKDHNQNKWRNYNDVRVTEVEEATVFEHANGECGMKTAYWVVYIN